MYISKKHQAIIDAFETEKEKNDYIDGLARKTIKPMQKLLDACTTEQETECLMNLFARLQKPAKLKKIAKPRYQKQTEEQKQEKKLRTLERKRERERQYNAKYYKDKPRKSSKEYDARYRKENAERIKKKSAKYYKENPEKYKERSIKHYANKKAEKQLIEII